MVREVLGSLRRRAVDRLRQAGIETAALDADLLFSHVLGKDRAWLHGHSEETVSPEQAGCFAALLDRRLDHEPVSRILGAREFYGLPFCISPDVLDPRPDTEALVDAVLKQRGDLPSSPVIADLGTGSGCILLSLLHEWPQATGVGYDISGAALRVATGNVAALGLGHRAAFKRAGWETALGGRKFDVIVSNPPYIPTGDLDGLAAEVSRFDPVIALDGGKDGLDAYRAIVPLSAAALRAGGLIALEVGAGEAVDVGAMMKSAGFMVETVSDLAGIERVVLGRPGKKAEICA